MLMAQALEKVFLQKVSQMPPGHEEVLPAAAPKVKPKKPTTPGSELTSPQAYKLVLLTKIVTFKNKETNWLA